MQSKRAMEGKLRGRRNRGRPRTRWLEDVEDDLRRIGVRRWRKEAADRTTWSGICKAVVLRSQSVTYFGIISFKDGMYHI